MMTKLKLCALAICLFMLFATFPGSAPAALAAPRDCVASPCLDVLTDPSRGEVVGIGTAKRPGTPGKRRPLVKKVPKRKPAETKSPICTVIELISFTCLKTNPLPPPKKPAVAAKPATISTDEVRKALPRAAIGFQPSAGAVVNVPTIFWSGVDSPITFSLPILGHKVEVHMTAHSTWVWGDGTSSSTTSTGGPYPNMGVTHIFGAAGVFHVSLRLSWTGSANLGNTVIAIVGPPVESASATYVKVGIAPTDLTPNE